VALPQAPVPHRRRTLPDPRSLAPRGAPGLTRAAIALGSNLGDRAANLERALAALALLPGTRLVARSTFVETSPVGPPQPDFLNAAAIVRTSLSPEALLGALLGIEAAMGRARTQAKGPRVIDLDLLTHGASIRRTRELTLPHPAMHRRAFVLFPLAAIAPRLRVPGRHATVIELLAKINPRGEKSGSCRRSSTRSGSSRRS